MRPHFYIYEQDHGCIVKAGEDGAPFHFGNVLEALAFAHRQRGEDGVMVSYFDASGALVFSKLLNAEE